MRSTQEWLYRPRDVDLRFRASLRHQLTLWLAGWLIGSGHRLVIWEWPQIHGSPGRLTSMRSGRKLLKGWVCCVPFWTGEAISPSGTESCCTYSSSAPWWIMRPPHGGSKAAGITIQVSSTCYGPPWYVSSRQIHKDLDVPLFADHITALNASFHSKLADVGNPLVRQLGRTLRWPKFDSRLLTRKPREAGASRPVEAIVRWPSRLKESRSALINRAPFDYPDWGFSVIFLSCKANARVYNAKSGHGPLSPLSGAAASPMRLTIVAKH